MDDGDSMRSSDTVNKKSVTKHKTNPADVTKIKGASDLLNAYHNMSFQARNLGVAFNVWQKMLKEDKSFIFFGLAGAMVPGGMRRVITFLIENRLIDAIVSTGANLFHDLYECLGYEHYKVSPEIGDLHLRRFRFDRIYDTIGDDSIYIELDNLVSEFAYSLEKRPYSSREFFYNFGKYLSPKVKEDGIITAAYKANVPIYCPAIVDSGYGLSLFYANKGKTRFVFDLIRDVEEVAFISASDKYTAGEILIGGGTPKNFIQQGPSVAPELGSKSEGYKYCVQIITDAEYWGGLSGCSFKEAQSWHKIHPEADMATVHCDATIALTLLATGLNDIKAWNFRKNIPVVDSTGKVSVKFKPR